jgi:hypothetical protein
MGAAFDCAAKLRETERVQPGHSPPNRDDSSPNRMDDSSVRARVPWGAAATIVALAVAAIIAARLQKPAPRGPGALVVLSRPGGAEIHVDGVKKASRTPATVAPASPGEHQVELLLPGYAHWACRVQIGPGATERIDAILTPSAGPDAAATGGAP